MPRSISRRSTLKLLAASSTLPALGYWAQSAADIRQVIEYSSFSTEQQNILTAIVDTLIPKGESWGALELGVPLYLLAYLDRCIYPKERASYKLQLDVLQKQAKRRYKKPFEKCDQLRREKLLKSFANSPEKVKRNFLELIKKQSIHGFNTTQEVMTGSYRFQIIPGHFKGCVDIDENPLR